MQNVVSRGWLGRVVIALLLSGLGCRGDSLSFANTNNIIINTDDNPPTVSIPYPSTITVSGLTGLVVTNLTVTLSGFTHPFPSDVNIILVGPLGQTALLMSDVGGATQGDPVTNVTLVLDDNSPYPLPIGEALFSATFHPTAGMTPLFEDLPPPAPAGNSNAPPTLSVFDGMDPDGVWSLFIVDDFEEVTNGYLSGGWSMSVSTGIPLQITNSAGNAVVSWPIVSGHTFTVQFAPGMTNVTWSNLSAIPAEVSGRYVVTNARVGPAGVFRLLVH